MDTLNFSEIINRIKKIKGWGEDKEVAHALGMKPPAFSERRKRNSVPTDKIALFAKKESINIDYLLTGEGAPQIKTVIGEVKQAVSRYGKQTRVIPILGEVPAGFPQLREEEVIENKEVPIGTEGDYGLIVKGHSMEEPDGSGLHDGDYIFFVQASVRPGDVVVSRNQYGETMVKKYVVVDGKGYLKSKNPVFPLIPIEEGFTLVGKVVDGVRGLKGIIKSL